MFKPTTVGTPQGGVTSPLLANIVLNHLDWQLDKLGYRFVRYADDFVVLCQTHAQAEEAKTQVTRILSQLGLQLSAEKTRITTYGKGYSFLGFVLSSRSKRMRPESQDKFKDKVRELTPSRQRGGGGRKATPLPTEPGLWPEGDGQDQPSMSEKSV